MQIGLTRFLVILLTKKERNKQTSKQRNKQRNKEIDRKQYPVPYSIEGGVIKAARKWAAPRSMLASQECIQSASG